VAWEQVVAGPATSTTLPDGQQPEGHDVVAPGTRHVVVLAVDVGGDGAADGDEPRPGGDGDEEPERHEDPDERVDVVPAWRCTAQWRIVEQETPRGRRRSGVQHAAAGVSAQRLLDLAPSPGADVRQKRVWPQPSSSSVRSGAFWAASVRVMAGLPGGDDGWDAAGARRSERVDPAPGGGPAGPGRWCPVPGQAMSMP
jgi:hypothetical protein